MDCSFVVSHFAGGRPRFPLESELDICLYSGRIARVMSVILRPSYLFAEVAQSVEQRTENPRVGGSIPSLGTTLILKMSMF